MFRKVFIGVYMYCNDQRLKRHLGKDHRAISTSALIQIIVHNGLPVQ